MSGLLMFTINLAWILIVAGMVGNVFGGAVGIGTFGILLKISTELFLRRKEQICIFTERA
jgi:hypothetical protein